MPKIRFSDLAGTEKRAVSWLAEEAETLTPNIAAAACHVGEIWEAANFMKEHSKGSTPHMILADRLRLGDRDTESILDCIKRAAPAYRSMAERGDDELDELLADLKGTSGS